MNICTPWATQTEYCQACGGDEFDPTLSTEMLLVASELLFELSGRQFAGECEDVVRPCARRNGSVKGWNSSWGFCGCNLDTSCSCAGLSQVELGAYPLRSITQVKVDGAVLDSSLYRIDEERFLVRLPDADGSRPGWPCCQRLDLDASEDETWSVSFTYGADPPALGVAAAAAVAYQLTLACQGSNKCSLPAKTQQVTRQGVSITTLQSPTFFDDLKFSVPAVGMFLEAYNPHGIRRTGAVWSPDTTPSARRVNT